MSETVFYILSIIAIFAALMVVFSRNPIHSVLYLILTFFAFAGHYIMLNAQFLAVVHIIVYAGAIMVLFLYVLMLMDLKKETVPQKNRWLKLAGVVAGGSLLLVLIAALRKVDIDQGIVETRTGDIGLIENLGKALFTEYVVPFEISSILFLSAMGDCS